jgi:hypothetical protein
VTDNRSLEEFVDAGAGSPDGEEAVEPAPEAGDAAGATEDAVRAAADAPEASAEPPDVSPATVTCEWTPGGVPCDACGTAVERRWRDGDARVCVDCKEW